MSGIRFNVGNSLVLLIQGLESMHNLAQKCIQLKPVSSAHTLLQLMIEILGENIEVCIFRDYNYLLCPTSAASLYSGLIRVFVNDIGCFSRMLESFWSLVSRLIYVFFFPP